MYFRTIDDNYVAIEEQKMVLSIAKKHILERKKAPYYLFICGPEGCGKSSICGEIAKIYGEEVIYSYGKILGNYILYIARESKKREAQFMYEHDGKAPDKKVEMVEVEKPNQEKRQLLIIDDFQEFPFHQMDAMNGLKILFDSCNVIVASSISLDALHNQLFESFEEFRLHFISRNSAKKILLDFVYQHRIILSSLIIDVLLRLYVEKKMTIEQIKDILFEYGKLRNTTKRRWMHEQNFHMAFQKQGLDQYVRHLILEALREREAANNVLDNESTTDHEFLFSNENVYGGILENDKER